MFSIFGFLFLFLSLLLVFTVNGT